MGIWEGEGADSEPRADDPVAGAVMIERSSFGGGSVVAMWEGNYWKETHLDPEKTAVEVGLAEYM